MLMSEDKRDGYLHVSTLRCCEGALAPTHGCKRAKADLLHAEKRILPPSSVVLKCDMVTLSLSKGGRSRVIVRPATLRSRNFLQIKYILYLFALPCRTITSASSPKSPI